MANTCTFVVSNRIVEKLDDLARKTRKNRSVLIREAIVSTYGFKERDGTAVENQNIVKKDEVIENGGEDDGET